MVMRGRRWGRLSIAMASAVFVSGCDTLLGIGNPDIVDGSADAAARPKDAASDSTVVVSRDAPKEIGRQRVESRYGIRNRVRE